MLKLPQQELSDTTTAYAEQPGIQVMPRSLGCGNESHK
jgi:hypothetical protein